MTLTVGSVVPDFTIATTEGDFTLSSLRGTPVVLYFYPKDDTPGCTTESCSFRDNRGILKKEGVKILGVSKDSLASHKKFIEKYELNFPLASDENGAVCAIFDTWIEKSMYGKKYMGIDRSTFLIDANGKIAQLWRNVKVPGHVEAVLDAVKTLQTSKAA